MAAHNEFFGALVGVVGVMILAGLLIVVGPRRLRETLRNRRERARKLFPAAAVLLVVVGIKSASREASIELSWRIGWEITHHIYNVEGAFVAVIQSVATPELTAYFGFVYIYVFSFLLGFPFIAYAALSNPRPFREAAAAFSINYLVGLVGYTLFVAYGPRNFVPHQIEGILYASRPSAHLLTSDVSVNTNVFPSLHTSFSATTALLAWRTRDTYPIWTAVATFLAASVIVATMYLGIHWLIDVIFGLALAYGSVRVAARDPLEDADRWIYGSISYVRTRLGDATGG